MISIHPLTEERLQDFFEYLTRHVAENGQEGALLFLPLSKAQSALSAEMKAKFASGLQQAFGEAGWRQVWVATDQDLRIVGHIDLRTHREQNAGHRVLLGMGVDRNFRHQHIGRKLMETVIAFGRNHPQISWIDLEVLDNNTPAKSLYQKMGFEQVGVTRDMFRIDHVSYAYASMTLQVGD